MARKTEGGSLPAPPDAYEFATTRWSMLRRAVGGGEEASSAMERWCRDYWPPVYAHVHRRVRDPHAAEDLTQDFFLKWVKYEWLKRPRPDQGKFRSFLLTVLKRFLRDEAEKSMAAKRGGGEVMMALEEMAGGGPAGPEEADAFDRDWAKHILDRAFAALREESDPGRFDRLKPFLQREAEEGEYRRLAAHFQGNPNAVGAAVRRLRLRLKQRLREEVAQTVGEADEVEEELTYLLRMMVS